MKKLLLSLLSASAVIFFAGCESMQKSVYDAKADIVGTDRTVTFYNWSGKAVKAYSDKSMRFETNPESISVWLGETNQKVSSNMFYIIEDNK